MDEDQKWMHHALQLARRAELEGEVPVGAVLVEDGQLIGEGWNRPISTNDPTAHAEIIALRAAALAKQNYRLPGSTLYITLEPCVMCCGAIFTARVSRIVFGAHDPKSGASGSIVNLFEEPRLNHHAQVTGGVMEQACSEVLSRFFRERR